MLAAGTPVSAATASSVNGASEATSSSHPSARSRTNSTSASPLSTMQRRMPPSTTESVPGYGLSQRLAYRVSSTSRESTTMSRCVPARTARLTGTPITFCSSIRFALTTRTAADSASSHIVIVPAK